MKQSLIPISLALSLCGGCTHITTKVPGVLDLRSDGSGAGTAKEAPKTTEETGRSGFSGIMYGDGVVANSADVTVTDRKYWVLRLIPIMNESATEEIGVALGDNGAMRNVKIGEQLSLIDIGISIVVGAIPLVNLLNIIMPPFDVNLSGTRIETAGGGAVEPPPPTDGAPPADPTAPSTTAPGT